MKLHDLQPPSGSHKPSRRVGRGHGSGRGKTAGRGTKGQKSRAGSGIPAWFEGGQTPLHVRTPKLHGFKNRFRVAYAPVNLASLSQVPAGTLVTPDVLRHDGLLRTSKTKQQPVKILGGGGKLSKKLTVVAGWYSKSAHEQIAKAGGTAQNLKGEAFEFPKPKKKFVPREKQQGGGGGGKKKKGAEEAPAAEAAAPAAPAAEGAAEAPKSE